MPKTVFQQAEAPIRRAGVGLVLEAKGRGPAHVAELAPGDECLAD